MGIRDDLATQQSPSLTGEPQVMVAGQVFVGQAGQVEIFDAEGHLSATWRDEVRMGLVTAVGFSSGSVLLGDARDRCIRRYDAAGSYLNDIGKDNRMKGFLIPNGVVDFGVDAKGMPFGLQIIGRAFAEETILRAAFTYEQNTEWHKNIASV